jgi:hemolysin III
VAPFLINIYIGAVLDWMEYPVLFPGYFGAHEVFHIAVLLGVLFHWIFLLQAIKSAEKSK